MARAGPDALFDAASAPGASRWGLTARQALGRVLARQDVSIVVHCLALMALVTVVRPLFDAPVAARVYESHFVAWELVKGDLDALAWSAQHRAPRVPRLLWLLIPTLALPLLGCTVRWTDWSAGKSLRLLVMTIALVLTWAASTFDYNMYLDRSHVVDRLLLLVLAALGWRYPLAIPPLLALNIIMLREASVPLPHDDFDWRPLGEMLVVFSCFAWASFRRALDTKHFVLLAVGTLASYYYCSGYAKLFYGETLSWLNDNHLSNLFVTSYVWGWLSFVPERFVLGVAALLRRCDYWLALYTLIVELGAVLYLVHARATRVWLYGVVLLHLGIFLCSGVFFWKWIVVNIAFCVFLRRVRGGGLEQLYRSKLVVLFSIGVILLSRHRLYYFPQLGVAWYDSSLVELYHIVAVGRSGQQYLVDPSTVTPMEARIVQGHFCYMTGERFFTGVYGTTGSLPLCQKFESFATREALEVYLRSAGRRCSSPHARASLADLFSRYFGNINRAGGKKHEWLGWINRPAHLWLSERVQPWESPLPLFRAQEPTARVELWRERVWHGAGSIQRLGARRIHQQAIPENITPQPGASGG